jgi:hypothetical protein
MGAMHPVKGRRRSQPKPHERRDPFKLASLLSKRAKAAQQAARWEREELKAWVEPITRARQALHKLEPSR